MYFELRESVKFGDLHMIRWCPQHCQHAKRCLVIIEAWFGAVIIDVRRRHFHQQELPLVSSIVDVLRSNMSDARASMFRLCWTGLTSPWPTEDIQASWSVRQSIASDWTLAVSVPLFSAAMMFDLLIMAWYKHLKISKSLKNRERSCTTASRHCGLGQRDSTGSNVELQITASLCTVQSIRVSWAAITLLLLLLLAFGSGNNMISICMYRVISVMLIRNSQTSATKLSTYTSKRPTLCEKPWSSLWCRRSIMELKRKRRFKYPVTRVYLENTIKTHPKRD